MPKHLDSIFLIISFALAIAGVVAITVIPEEDLHPFVPRVEASPYQ